MNSKASKQCRILVAFLAFILCIMGAHALVADATYVGINDVPLTAFDPYWKNGGGGSASDWNAFFDTSTSTPTLILKDAVIDSFPYDYMIWADGDLVLELQGNSTLSYIGGTSYLEGIGVDGNLIIKDGTADGTGSINLSYTGFGSDVYGMKVFGNLTIESGTIDIMIDTARTAYGLYTHVQNLYVHGGTTNVQVNGPDPRPVYTRLFNLINGSITVTTDSEMWYSSALEFHEALVTGGVGRFLNIGSGFGAIWGGTQAANKFRVLDDGHLIFSGSEEALYFATDETIVPEVSGRILVSTDNSGAGKFVWDSSSGVLAGNYMDYTSFSYVELMGASVPFSQPEGSGFRYPQTGDSSRLWLWLGIGLVALLGAGALLGRYRKHK